MKLNRENAKAAAAAREAKRAAFSPTLQEKYDWLCKQLEITNPDFCEQDATIKFKNPWPDVGSESCRSLYFQFSHNEYPDTIDEAVILAMRSELK